MQTLNKLKSDERVVTLVVEELSFMTKKGKLTSLLKGFKTYFLHTK